MDEEKKIIEKEHLEELTKCGGQGGEDGKDKEN